MISVTSQSNLVSGITTPAQLAPLVTVICISYNHEPYVIQALQSVARQTYASVELIVIDNSSTDQSVERIREFVQHYPSIRFIANSTNIGLNRAFNQGLALASGKYIIDLSADDVLLPDRIAKQVSQFEQLPDYYGVVFSNAAYIDAHGHQLGFHYKLDPHGHARAPIPTGAIFRYVLEAYFICTPTMMMRRDMLDSLGGYDETLSYEDFDFWVRSSRLYHYAYLDEVLTLKRKLPNSLSTQVVQTNNHLLPSTLIVCQKAFERCSIPEEFQALAARLQTFVRKAFYTEQFDLALQFGNILHNIAPPDLQTRLVLRLSRLRVPVNRFYRQYLKYRTKPV